MQSIPKIDLTSADILAVASVLKLVAIELDMRNHIMTNKHP